MRDKPKLVWRGGGGKLSKAQKFKAAHSLGWGNLVWGGELKGLIAKATKRRKTMKPKGKKT